jgi:ketosteroid isomerase-like protein
MSEEARNVEMLRTLYARWHDSRGADVASWLECMADTVDHFVAQGDRVVMLGRCAWKHRATGKFVDTPKADAITLADGKIVGFMEYYDTAQALAATVG